MIKQVIVVRKDLHMRRGKIISQCCHASMKVLLDRSFRYFTPETKSGEVKTLHYQLSMTKDEPLYEWLEGKFTKIVVYCNMESELKEVEVQCHYNQIPYATITDFGLTEFHGKLTDTCVAVGPWHSDEIDKITGDFKLL